MEKDFYIKKNILDLNFQKHLVYLSTSIIIGFTYVVGVIIATLTGQIILDSFFIMTLLVFASVGILGPCFIFLRRSIRRLRQIQKTLMTEI